MKTVTVVLSVFLYASCSQISLNLKPVKPKKKFFKASWIKNLDVKYSSGNLPIGLQAPLIVNEMLYIGHNKGSMHAFNISNGREVWSVEEGHPYHSSPIVHGRKLIYGNVEGRLFARERLNGKLIYSIDLGSAVESQPLFYKGRLLVHTRNHKIVCLDAETGKVLWAYKRSVPFLTTLQRVSRPIVLKNKIFVGFADGYVASFGLEEGLLLWESKVVDGAKFIDVDTQPLVFNGKIVVGAQTGHLTVLNPSGGIVERKLKLSTGRSPLVIDDNLLVGTIDGELVIIDGGFNIKKRYKISQDSITSTGLWKGHIIASTTGGDIIAVGKNLAQIKETFSFGNSSSSLFGRLEIKEGKLAAYSSRNRLYVFD